MFIVFDRLNRTHQPRLIVEKICVLLKIAENKIVTVDNSESMPEYGDHRPNEQVNWAVEDRVLEVTVGLWNARRLQELAANDASVLERRLENGDHVIGEPIGQNEATVLVLGANGHHGRGVTQGFVVIFKHFDKVFFRWLRDKAQAVLNSVINRSESVVRRYDHFTWLKCALIEVTLCVCQTFTDLLSSSGISIAGGCSKAISFLYHRLVNSSQS